MNIIQKEKIMKYLIGVGMSILLVLVSLVGVLVAILCGPKIYIKEFKGFIDGAYRKMYK